VKYSDNEESTYIEVLSVLSTDAYKEFARSVEDPHRYQFESSQLQSVVYDKRLSPACDYLPESLPGIDLNAVLQQTQNQLGIVHHNYLVLNVQEPSTPDAGRLIFVEDTQLLHIYPTSSLTPAELRTLKQILCGHSLRDSAVTDSVSYETKRSQFKSLGHKIGISRQADVVTYTLTRLLASNLRDDTEPALHEEVRAYHRECLPPNVRLHIMLGDDGRHHRIFDMGPIDGTALICLHPQIFPGFRPQDIELLHARNIRLLWPLRQGQMAPADPVLSSDAHIAHAIQSIDLAKTLQINHDTTTLVALVSGGTYAIEYALLNPLIDRVVFVGASYKAGVGNSFSDKFRYGLIKLASRNKPLTRKLLHFLGKKLRDKNMLTKFFLNLYSGCESDLQVLEEEFSSEQKLSAIQRRILSSENSIIQDFFAHIRPNWPTLSMLGGKFVFIHGQQDTAHSIDDIRALAVRHNAPVRELEGLGQLLYYEHMGPLLDSLNELL
jgi:DNA-binding CsgD family transcriptional regulator